MATASALQRENPQPLAAAPNRKKLGQKKFVRLTLWPLVAATFFMVSGGTYGTEDIVHGAGYGRAILILLLTPLLWSLPTAFMIGELSSALPKEGGYYAWVRYAMGKLIFSGSAERLSEVIRISPGSTRRRMLRSKDSTGRGNDVPRGTPSQPKGHVSTSPSIRSPADPEAYIS